MPPSSWLLCKDKIICENQQDIDRNYLEFRGNSGITSFDEFELFTGVTELRPKEFGDCISLKSIVFPASLKETISRDNFTEGAFERCNNLTNVTLNEGLRIISANTFEHTAINKITIPDSVLKISNGAFSDTNLTELILPNNLQYFGGYNGNNTYIRKIVIPDSVTTVGLGIGYRLGNKSANKEKAIVVIGKGITKFEGCQFFRDCNAKTKILYIKSVIPPQLPDTTYHNTDIIYVPVESVETYKTATFWNSLSNIIQSYDFEVNPDNI